MPAAGCERRTLYKGGGDDKAAGPGAARWRATVSARGDRRPILDLHRSPNVLYLFQPLQVFPEWLSRCWTSWIGPQKEPPVRVGAPGGSGSALPCRTPFPSDRRGARQDQIGASHPMPSEDRRLALAWRSGGGRPTAGQGRRVSSLDMGSIARIRDRPPSAASRLRVTHTCRVHVLRWAWGPSALFSFAARGTGCAKRIGASHPMPSEQARLAMARAAREARREDGIVLDPTLPAGHGVHPRFSRNLQARPRDGLRRRSGLWRHRRVTRMRAAAIRRRVLE